MKKVRQFVAIALGLALMLTAGAAMAQKDRGMHGMQQGQGMQQGYGYGQGYGQMNPEMMQQMRDIQAQYADKMYDLRSQLFAKQQELSAAMAGEQVNADRVRSLVDEINNLRGELFSARTEMQIEMRQKGIMSSYGGYGMGPGMMGPGMMGPGMMHGGGYGMGPGMMGPGMMHGRGMGPGMMRGMGPGMMYGCPYQQNY
ncbi:MAG: periplasmic heavy metal sensor [Desulfohalobiaceae bacterium]|nr:periplasmic heavy metal sensor [Desulfohalobiaceae bacterium]